MIEERGLDMMQIYIENRKVNLTIRKQYFFSFPK